jgi:hypothetical protein
MKKIVATLAICLTATGCASIFSGTTTDVSIRTTPGTNYTVTNTYGTQVASGVTGDDATATVNLKRGASYFSPHAYKMKLSKIGYRPATVEIDPNINGWYFGNIAIGGFIGMVIVDPLTGAMWRMVPRADDVPLEPTGEDIALLNHQAAIIKSAQNFKVSKNDYAARQIVMGKKCDQLATPEVTTTNYVETLRFECKDGRTIDVVCKSEYCQ